MLGSLELCRYAKKNPSFAKKTPVAFYNAHTPRDFCILAFGKRPSVTTNKPNMRAQISSFLLILPALVCSVRIPEDWQVEEAKEAILEAIEEDQDFGAQILRLGNYQLFCLYNLGKC